MNSDEFDVPSGFSAFDWAVAESPLTSSAQVNPDVSQGPEEVNQSGSPLTVETSEECANHPEMRKALKALMDKNITLVE